MRTNNKKLFVLVLSMAAIVVGVYMTYFHKNKPEEDVQKMVAIQTGTEQIEEEKQVVTGNPYDYSNMKLPEEDNESEGELYNGGKANIEVYFANTERLDASSMPLEAQAALCSGVQKYLVHRGYEDVSELYVDDDSFVDTDEKISFQCFMDGHEEKLQIEYEDGILSYSIIDSTGGERN